MVGLRFETDHDQPIQTLSCLQLSAAVSLSLGGLVAAATSA